jgi:hypothetical protein
MATSLASASFEQNVPDWRHGAEDPLRRRLREPEPFVPLAGAPAGCQAPNGSAPIRCCRLSRRSGASPGSPGRARQRRVLRRTAPAPEERLVPISSRGHPTAGADDRVESSSGVARRIASPASPGPHRRHRGPAGNCRGRRLLPEAVAARCVERERANPTCQRAPEHHGDVRAPGAPGARGRRASRRSARFSRAFRGRCRRSRPVPARNGGFWRSGSSRTDWSCDGGDA